MDYTEARAAHAAGHNVSCGRGVRAAYSPWNEMLDLPLEISADWYITPWSDVVRAKKTTKPGQCPVMRCKAGSAVGSTVNPMHLCEKHLDEWTNAGCPPMDETPAAADVPQDLAVVAAEVVTPLREATSGYLQTIATIELTSQPALDWLGAVREGVRQALADLEERRTSITKPMNEAKRKVDALFQPAKDQCKAVIDACDARMNQFRAEQRRLQDAALSQIQNGHRDDQTIAHAHLTGPALPGQVTARKDYKYTVLDFAQVPDAFKTTDHEALMGYIRARFGRVDIPGIAVQEIEEVRTAPGAAHVETQV